jgi:prepilin-type processing-associated H-X9-DG protein
MKTKPLPVAPRGFTRVELVVILSVVVVLSALLWLVMRDAKGMASLIGCSNQLKQVGLSFRIFATDNGDCFPMQVMTDQSGAPAFLDSGDVYRYFLSASNGLGTPLVLRCPADRTRTVTTNWSTLKSENISYFVGLDAQETAPQMMLSGDSSLTTNNMPVKPGLLLVTTNVNLGWGAGRHRGIGNILFADGSIGQNSSAELREQSRQWVATNRLLLP